MINKVTITGADDSVKPEDLVKLSKEFPFVEWGILFSPKRYGQSRYPSVAWLTKLRNIEKLKFSAHICGGFSRSLFQGCNDSEILNYTCVGDNTPLFERCQLNYNSTKNGYDLNSLFEIIEKYPDIQFIFQHNKANAVMNSIIMHLKVNYNLAFLYDSSGGRGLAPTDWNSPIDNYYTGYSGGLNPNNLEENIKLIEEHSVGLPTWIDMETGVRSEDGKSFDLSKVRKCLEIASKYIKA